MCRRIGVEVCRARGVPAEPLAVAADIDATGSLKGGSASTPDGVDSATGAHVVCVVERRRLVDLTPDQVIGAGLGMDLEPIALTVPAGFIRGGSDDDQGTRVRYPGTPKSAASCGLRTGTISRAS